MVISKLDNLKLNSNRDHEDKKIFWDGPSINERIKNDIFYQRTMIRFKTIEYFFDDGFYALKPEMIDYDENGNLIVYESLLFDFYVFAENGSLIKKISGRNISAFCIGPKNTIYCLSIDKKSIYIFDIKRGYFINEYKIDIISQRMNIINHICVCLIKGTIFLLGNNGYIIYLDIKNTHNGTNSINLINYFYSDTPDTHAKGLYYHRIDERRFHLCCFSDYGFYKFEFDSDKGCIEQIKGMKPTVYKFDEQFERPFKIFFDSNDRFFFFNDQNLSYCDNNLKSVILRFHRFRDFESMAFDNKNKKIALLDSNNKIHIF